MLPPIAAVHANVNITVFFLDTYFFILSPPLNQIQCNIKSLPWLTRKATFIKHIKSSFKKLKWFCSNYLPISRRSIWQQTIRQFFWLKFIVLPSLPGNSSGGIGVTPYYSGGTVLDLHQTSLLSLCRHLLFHYSINYIYDIKLFDCSKMAIYCQ